MTGDPVYSTSVGQTDWQTEGQTVRQTIRTFTDAARELELEVGAVRGLVRAWGSPLHPVPRNGNAKGIDERTFKMIKRARDLGRKQSA